MYYNNIWCMVFLHQIFFWRIFNYGSKTENDIKNSNNTYVFGCADLSV